MNDKAPKTLFGVSLLASVYIYGVASEKFEWFPYPQLVAAVQSVKLVRQSFESEDILYHEADSDKALQIKDRSAKQSEGLILVIGIIENRENIIRVIDRAGDVVYELKPDWFNIWGDSEGEFPAGRRPQTAPGALIHGMDFLDNGDMVMNFEHLSTMRMNFCGDVVWKLDNLGHHAVHVTEDGTIWAPSETYYDKDPTPYRNHFAPLRSWNLQNISADGEVLEIIPVFEVLQKNGLYGLLALSSLVGNRTSVSGDTLHLNDVETFPSDLRSTLFKPGDIMFSLRNISTIIVMDPQTHKVKFRSTGEVLRQHDPDFMQDDVISIFDNHNLLPSGGIRGQSSRIVELDAVTGDKKVVAGDGGKARFFTDIMGNHQRLGNGNVLINSAVEGRVLEVLPDGSVVWEYSNKLANGKVGLVTVAMVLPAHMNREFFIQKQEQCH